jgi:hypothetical protein
VVFGEAVTLGVPAEPVSWRRPRCTTAPHTASSLFQTSCRTFRLHILEPGRTMSRCIELGRAVLCSPDANLELWLTTLITLSLTDENNMQQLKPAHLLDYLASGDIWVGRSHGMHVRLKLSIGEEPLAHRHLQNLTDAILRAPVGALALRVVIY